MKKDGTLTKQEERTVLRAMEIINDWVSLHVDDENPPYGFGAIASAAHALDYDAWCMFYKN